MLVEALFSGGGKVVRGLAGRGQLQEEGLYLLAEGVFARWNLASAFGAGKTACRRSAASAQAYSAWGGWRPQDFPTGCQYISPTTPAPSRMLALQN